MNQQSTATGPVNGATSAHDLFALTDEQILEIEPVSDDAAAGEQPLLAVQDDRRENGTTSEAPTRDSASSGSQDKPTQALRDSGQARVPTLLSEPPAWLAKQMKDPWAGEEALELWEGVQRAQTEAAEYKQVFEKPEAARAAAERARALDEFDAAYFGAAGKSAEETATGRAALAQRMLREDPAAFQEMVLAGVRALEGAKKQGSAVPATESAAAPAQVQRGTETREANPEAQRHLAAYSEFEKSANQDLEKSVGATIDRALQQALPNAGRGDSDGLKLRLATGVRQEIERTLQGDRQLGEQVAQVLSARRFDETARAQVVRLINDRAQQLVPSATKRVLNDWTQTTLAAHRSKTEKQETSAQRADLAPTQQGRDTAPARTDKNSRASARSDRPRTGRVDYKKLSDEQILEL